MEQQRETRGAASRACVCLRRSSKQGSGGIDGDFYGQGLLHHTRTRTIRSTRHVEGSGHPRLGLRGVECLVDADDGGVPKLVAAPRLDEVVGHWLMPSY